MYYDSLVVWNPAGYWDHTDFHWSNGAVCHEYSNGWYFCRDNAPFDPIGAQTSDYVPHRNPLRLLLPLILRAFKNPASVWAAVNAGGAQ
jgi:hypothetical protein